MLVSLMTWISGLLMRCSERSGCVCCWCCYHVIFVLIVMSLSLMLVSAIVLRPSTFMLLPCMTMPSVCSIVGYCVVVAVSVSVAIVLLSFMCV